MIVINIQGGLGNQMFIYAFAKALSLRNNISFKVDNGSFTRYLGQAAYTPRPYELDKVFGIEAELFSEEDRKRLLPDGPLAKAKRLLERKFLPANRQVYIAEGESGFRADLLHVRHNCYLDGYWQSEGYFSDFAPQIRALFTLRQLSAETITWQQQIAAAPMPVSVHIRRGDYVNNPEVARIHNVCGPEYYARAIAHLEAKTGAPLSLFFFSDDINWVKENMAFPQHQNHYVQLHDALPAEEMFLMSRCHHNIIANSSFSWWGGWLNEHADKIVVAPQRWFAAGVHEQNSAFIIPKNWTKI
jgi:hypothetical protein